MANNQYGDIDLEYDESDINSDEEADRVPLYHIPLFLSNIDKKITRGRKYHSE